MSYGILLKNANTNSSYQDDNLIFYSTQREGISTSDPMYFTTVNFTAKTIGVSFEKYGNLISNSSSNNFSFSNFDLNEYNFKGLSANLSKPTIVELCKIKSYELGAGQTIYADTFIAGDKYIKNFNDPGNIYTKTSTFPTGLTTSYFGTSLNYTLPSSGVQNFVYVSFEDNTHSKYFLAVPQSIGATIPNNFRWYELPNNVFFNDIDYYFTINASGFNGTNISINSFNGIIPSKGKTILINNVNYDDTYSGVYVIQTITNNVILSRGNIVNNFPGQTFNIKINLDNSNALTYNTAVYYVPFEYGYTSDSFTKALKLTKFTNPIQNDPTKYTPLFKDNYDNSSLILQLNTISDSSKKSDAFILGIGVSNWFPDSILYNVNVSYQIKEGY